MTAGDRLYRFVFENTGVRGEWVRLNATWQAALQNHAYPAPVRDPLGQAMAAAALLSATLKFQGSLILQAQGSGPLTTLVVHATHERNLRGLAHWCGEVPKGDLSQVFGNGHIAITLDVLGKERYQGIVPLAGKHLAEAIQLYFQQSEQLPTRLWLCANAEQAAGLLLQTMPSQPGQTEDWQRIALLADTVYRLFHEERLRLFEAEPVAFRCNCSRQRIVRMLRALGGEELRDILANQGSIEVDCEFCNRHYHFDRIDVEHLLASSSAAEAAATRH